MSIMYFAGRSGCIRNLSDHKLEVAPLGEMGGNRMVDGLARLMNECETFAILCRCCREQGTKHLGRYLAGTACRDQVATGSQTLHGQAVEAGEGEQRGVLMLL